MIVPMKKVTLVCMASDQKSTLDSLRDLGVMHLTPITEPLSEEIDKARANLQKAESAVTILDGIKPPKNTVPKPTLTLDTEAAIDKVHELTNRGEVLADELAVLDSERELIKPFGNFDPSLLPDLADKSVVVRLYSAPAKELIEAPDGVTMFTLSANSTTQYFALVARNDFDFAGEEAILPASQLSEIEAAIAKARADTEEINKELLTLKSAKDVIAESTCGLEGVIEYAVAKDGMASSDHVSYLQGYCPADLLDKVRAKTADLGWGLVIEDPEKDDEPPTLVRYPRWVEPIKAVFDVLGILPGYREADISMVFLLFFSVFFAMLIGDAGYGVLFLGLTIFARRKMKDAPAYPFVLFGILSACTAIWGVLTGNYFGIPLEALPPFLQSLTSTWLTNIETSRDNIIKLCFTIGALHLTVAHIWNAVVLFPSRKWLAQLGWIGLVWCMFFAAGHYVLSYDYPSWILGVFLPSLVLVALFMTSKKDMKTEWIHHAMLPLSVINCFVDVISYIRLFAVGMASAKVAMSVNMIVNLDASKIWTIPIIAVILLAGHALNIALCGLGILVHGVRLNTLEFSLHRDMQWSGFPYKPFMNRITKT
jgi:V/A-type H+-transporting ATPase subunit I